MKQDRRRFEDLVSVGPAMRRDFDRLGIGSVAELARSDPKALYERLARVTGQRPDVCVLDVVRAADAQARNPRLPAEQSRWWWWSRRRLEARPSRSRAGRQR